MAAVQPQNRPAGSDHLLEWLTLEQDTANAATYPKLNGNYPAGVAVATLFPVRFLLADSSDLDDSQKRLPGFVFDDAVPAGDSPHDFVLGGSTQGILTATDKNITARTWCQNLEVTVTPRDVASGPGANGMSVWDPAATRVCLDVGASSGLGTDTGLPVVVIGIIIRTGGAVQVAYNIDVKIRIRPTSSR